MTEPAHIDFDDFAGRLPEAVSALRALSQVGSQGIDKQLLELLKVRASQLNGCAYCLQLHSNWARQAGVPQAKLDRVAAWREAPGFAPEERAVLAWTEALTDPQRRGEIPAARCTLEETFGEQQSLRLTVAVAAINAWNRIAGPLGISPPAATSGSAPMTTIDERRKTFRALHQSGCFVLPNPWDAGSALRLAQLGFSALASTSAGAAWALGKADGEMTLEEVLQHLLQLVSATELPVNADFEAGFADSAAAVASSVERCIATGVAGLSIEDRSGKSLYPLDVAVERIQAARAAIDRCGANVVLVGRCESFLIGQPDLPATIARLQAYGAAGADCLYAPGIKDLGSIAQLVRSVDKPVNALLAGTGLSVAELANVGVRRVSVGGALARASWTAFDNQAGKLRTEGRL
jgi:AhpD family alkylhydroperoxidase